MVVGFQQQFQMRCNRHVTSYALKSLSYHTTDTTGGIEGQYHIAPSRDSSMAQKASNTLHLPGTQARLTVFQSPQNFKHTLIIVSTTITLNSLRTIPACQLCNTPPYNPMYRTNALRPYYLWPNNHPTQHLIHMLAVLQSTAIPSI